MASHDDLRKQVESLRQVNSSLQREIHENNAQLSRLHENSTQLVRLGSSGGSTPNAGGAGSQTGSNHSSRASSNTSSPKVARCQPMPTWSAAQSPRVLRQAPQQGSNPVSSLPTSVSHSRQQSDPTFNYSQCVMQSPRSAAFNQRPNQHYQQQQQQRFQHPSQLVQGNYHHQQQPQQFLQNPHQNQTPRGKFPPQQQNHGPSLQPLNNYQQQMQQQQPTSHHQQQQQRQQISYSQQSQGEHNIASFTATSLAINHLSRLQDSSAPPAVSATPIYTQSSQQQGSSASVVTSSSRTADQYSCKSLGNTNTYYSEASSQNTSSGQTSNLTNSARSVNSAHSNVNHSMENCVSKGHDSGISRAQSSIAKGTSSVSKERRFEAKGPNSDRSTQQPLAQQDGSGEGCLPLDTEESGQTGDLCFSYNEESEGERMAILEDGVDIIDTTTTLDPLPPDSQKGQGHEVKGQGESAERSTEGSKGSTGQDRSTVITNGHLMVENDREIVERLQQLGHERTNLVQQIESEEKNRKWYYDQMEIISRKIRSLPVTDGHPGKQPGLTRKHLEFEIERLRDTMLSSFGTNEQIGQRQDSRVQRICHIDGEITALRQRRQQLLQESNDSRMRRESSSDSGDGGDGDQVTMATQTDTNGQDATTTHVPGAIYHGTWPIGDDPMMRPGGATKHGDLASVMSFNSTNTASSQGSAGVNRGQCQSSQQPLPQQPLPQQIGPIPLQIPPQQLGTKVEMVYGLLSMLGTHDKDDMSKTLLAMSSSQDSCIAMRQSGCLPLLIQLLHSCDQDQTGLLGNTRATRATKARAAASLHNIVHSHPDDKRGRREARVLRLLEQIRAHCDQLRDSGDEDEEEEEKEQGPEEMDHHPGPAIATLMKLSFDEEYRHAICTLGGLHAIAELLQVDNDVHQATVDQYNVTMRRYACMALTNLTFGDGTNKALLCSMRTSMGALVAQLFSSNEDLCQVAASVLRNLSWKADLASKKTLREVGAVTSLMKAAMCVQKETTLKSILSALWNLSAHCSENKADICAVIGALEFLINTLTYKSPSKTTAIIENGGGILRNVSSHIAVREDYRETLRQHGCLQILLKHLRSPSLTIVSNACGTLWNLSARCAEDQQTLWELGAVGMLRNLVHSKHKMISMGSSAALKNLLAARPAMKNFDVTKHNNNRPSLHVRKQRALEAEIDQNLAETCENVESPRDSPVESKKQESAQFVYPVYPIPDNDPRRALLRSGPIIPRSQSGDNALLHMDSRTDRSVSGVARSGSQDSVGSTHSDISHDRSRHASGGAKPSRAHSTMGGSLDRHKEGLQPRVHFEGRTEHNPLGSPNSRILQVMQEVALHAGIDGQSHNQQNDSAVFKKPFPVTSMRSQAQSQQPNSHLLQASSSSTSNHHQQQVALNYSQQQQQPHFAGHMFSPQAHTSAYQRFLMNAIPPHGASPGQFSMASMMSHRRSSQDNDHNDADEKPLDYSMKYQEGLGGMSSDQHNPSSMANHDPRFTQSLQHPLPHTLVGNYVGSESNMVPNLRKGYSSQGQQQPGSNVFMTRSAPIGQPIGGQLRFNSAYAETDLDDPDQPTDYSARYGVENSGDQYQDGAHRYNQDERMNYSGRYTESDPHCADCKLEEARRYHDDRLDNAMDEDQVRTFCTEDTPYLSTATSMTDLSTAVKILEEAEEQCPNEERDDSGDEMHNFSSKYGETECQVHNQRSRQNNEQGQRSIDQGHNLAQRSMEHGQGHSIGQRSLDGHQGHGSDFKSDDGQKGLRFDGEKSSRSGSNMTDVQTGTTVIANYHLKAGQKSQDSSSMGKDDAPPRSFHDNRNDDAPFDQTKTYCEEGTPVCFSRVSSLSSLHSSEAADRQEKRPQNNVLSGNLQAINESDDPMNHMSGTPGKMPEATNMSHNYRQKDEHSDSGEKEHKTVTFDEKEQIQETPMMFSRCTSLGSLSSFDTQSVHSSVFSEYSRRASEVVSPSELPDSPSETMPPSPRRTKSPERNPNGRKVNTELFPPIQSSNNVVDPRQFSSRPNDNIRRVNPLQQLLSGFNQSQKPMDFETGSNRSEAPVVYADEGTPPVFNDNLSELSCITGDNYNINDKTLVDSTGNMTPGSKSQGSGSNKSANTTLNAARRLNETSTSNTSASNADKHEIKDSEQSAFNNLSSETSTSRNNDAKDSTKEAKVENEQKKSNETKDDDKAFSSNSDVSEGEDDLLASFISQAMPISLKKSRKSSDNNAKRKPSSSKPDSGSSSRSKTPAKSQPQSGASSKSSSVNSSAKKPTKLDSNMTSNDSSPNQKHSTDSSVKATPHKGQGQRSQGSSPGKQQGQQQRSHIPRPLQHRQLQQLSSQLDCSVVSTGSFQSDSSPFNTSNTGTVITRPSQNQKQTNAAPLQASPLILQKARNLSKIQAEDNDEEDEGITTYATEDTPFSGSIPASPKAERRFQDNMALPDCAQDTVKSYATEDTPFSGSVPASPPLNRRNFNNDVDVGEDTVRCYNTEDTPFSGSAYGSPKMSRKQFPEQSGLKSHPPQQLNQQNRQQQNQQQQMTSAAQSFIPRSSGPFGNTPQNIRPNVMSAGQFMPQTSTVRMPGPQQFPKGQNSSQGQNPAQARGQMYQPRMPVKSQFNPQMLNNLALLGNNFEDDGGDDCPKTFATEGTPQNFSRTGSYSDLSSLNGAFDEKVKIDSSNVPTKTSDASNVNTNTKSNVAKDSDVSANNLNKLADDSDSSLEENEDLLTDLIQSAMPAPKPGPSKPGRSMDRVPEGAESRGNKSNVSNVPSHFQPKRTSSLAHDGNMAKHIGSNKSVGTSSQSGAQFNQEVYSYAGDQLKTYAMEGTPSNLSNATSLSDLTTDSYQPKPSTSGLNLVKKQESHGSSSFGNQNMSSIGAYDHSSTFGTGNDSVFLHSDGGGDSMKIYKMEGTPQSFSCNESLSSLGIVDNDSSNEMAIQVKALANRLTQNRDDHESGTRQSIASLPNTSQHQNLTDAVIPDNASDRSTSTRQSQSSVKHVAPVDQTSISNKERSDSRTSINSTSSKHSRISINSNSSKHSKNEIERHVIGQSSEDQSVHEDEVRNSESYGRDLSNQEQIKKYQVEDTPLCFSVNSSLSDIHDLANQSTTKPERKPGRRSLPVGQRFASKDENSGYKMEHTPICFSRNSSLSDLSVHSDEDDDPNEMALLEDCITSALPPKSRNNKSGSVGCIGNIGGYGKTSAGRTAGRSAGMHRSSSGDELESSSQRGTRQQYGSGNMGTGYQQNPVQHRSSEDIFRVPTADARGRPCIGNAGTEQQTQQQIISESKNLSQQVMQMTRSAEKGEDRNSDKNDSPASDYNFFMTCSGNTEISVEGISKQSFPSSMAPSTDDDILDGSINMIESLRNEGEGECQMISSRDNTLTDAQLNQFGQRSLNNTITEARVSEPTGNTGQRLHAPAMISSLTSEDERALAENANIVMTEIRMNQMVLSGGSSVNEENFIENETLSLVSNDYMSDTASEASNTWSENSGTRPDARRPRILKPGDVSNVQKNNNSGEKEKAIKGKRKALYSNPNKSGNKTLGSSSSSPQNIPSSAVAMQQNKQRSQTHNTSGGSGNTSKTSPRMVPGSANTSSGSSGNTSRRSHTLRTQPQASSTPVKSDSPAQRQTRSLKSTPQPRSSSLDQRSQPHSRSNSLDQRSMTYSNSPAQRSQSTSRSGSVTRVSNNSPHGNSLHSYTGPAANRSSSSNKSNKSTPKSKSEVKDTSNKNQPKGLSKQGTFIKESTNKNAPVISPNDKTKDIATSYSVKMRQKKVSDSSSINRNSSGSSRSNFSNMSNNSNSFSTSSSDSPPDSWSKALNTYNYSLENDPLSSKKKGKKGSGAASNVRRNLMNEASMSKIPSPTRSGLNKSNSGGSMKRYGKENSVHKSNSGPVLGKSSALNKTGSNNSLKQTGSRPTTPVVTGNRKESIGSQNSGTDAKKNKKTVTSKIAGLWRSEKAEKEKPKKEKKAGSKLPVAQSKGKSKKSDNVEASFNKTGDSKKAAGNRNTYILTESSVDRLTKSSTYDKLDLTNDRSNIPSHDDLQSSRISAHSGQMTGSASSNATVTLSDDRVKPKSVLQDQSQLDKTCRDISVFEFGVEYDLEEAWASNIEKSIEVMSRSIEENKNKIDNYYDEFVDTSKMDLTNSPANRLSKSGSMTEIELEFGRIHSGTWTKKKSHNEFTALPNADETSKTLPLKKRSESLNFSTHLGVTQSLEFDDEGQQVWIRRDDRLRASDITMSKKKKSFKGSSGFLSAVSKMFTGGSKKAAGDKQSKSFTVSEKDQKKLNESTAKSLKKDKMNKSEVKDSVLNASERKLSKSDQKAELKQLKAEQKAEMKQLRAESKQLKSDLKALKKDGKLNKSLKAKLSVDQIDVSSSTSSLKKSAEDLIDIDKSDDDADDVFFSQGGILAYAQTGSQVPKENDWSTGENCVHSPKPKGGRKSHSESDSQYNSVNNTTKTMANSALNTTAPEINQNSTAKSGSVNSITVSPNNSIHGSPNSCLTKTDMLLARRHAQLSSSPESDDSDSSVTKKKPIITTV